MKTKIKLLVFIMFLFIGNVFSQVQELPKVELSDVPTGSVNDPVLVRNVSDKILKQITRSVFLDGYATELYVANKIISDVNVAFINALNGIDAETLNGETKASILNNVAYANVDNVFSTNQTFNDTAEFNNEVIFNDNISVSADITGSNLSLSNNILLTHSSGNFTTFGLETLTANRTINFPDKTGIAALVSDINKTNIDALGINATHLGGILPANFLRSDVSDTMSGNLTVTGNTSSSNISVTSSNWLGFGDYGERIVGNNSNSTLKFFTDATEAISIDGSQNTTFTGTGTFGGDVIIDDLTNGRLTFDNTATANRILSTTTAFSAYKQLQFRATNYSFLKSNGSSIATLNSTGLEVTGTATFGGTLFTKAVGMTISENYSSGNDVYRIYDNNGEFTIESQIFANTVSDSSPIVFKTSNSSGRLERVRIGSNGLLHAKFGLQVDGAGTFGGNITATGFKTTSQTNAADKLLKADGTTTSLASILAAASGGEKYTWADNTARDAQTGMVTNDIGVVTVDRKKYRYNGSSWDFMYDLDGTYSFASLTSIPTTISGYGITDAYTKSETDGKYLLNTTDTFTGNLNVDGSVMIWDTTNNYITSFKGLTGDRNYGITGHSSADYNLTFENTSTGNYNVNVNGELIVKTNDTNNTLIFGVAGDTTGIRVGESAGTSLIEAVDDTFFAEYKPLKIRGSQITLQSDIDVTGIATFGGNVIVGNNTSASLSTRHIDGKSPTTNADDILFLNHSNGFDVRINGNTAYHAGNLTNVSQLSNDSGYVTSSGNTIIGTDTDITTSGAEVISTLNMTDGVIQSHSKRTLTLANLGFSDTNYAKLNASNIFTSYQSIESANPVLYLRDTDGTGSGMTSSYVAYKDSGNTTRAWVGYGDSSTDFNIQNNLGNVTVNGDKVATEDWVTANTTVTTRNVNNQTADYTLALTDAEDIITFDMANILPGGHNPELTIPLNSSVAFPIGTKIDVINKNGVAVELVTPVGVDCFNDSVTLGFGERGVLTKLDTNEWIFNKN